MPVYLYKCKACGVTKEFAHSMSEVDEPTEETIQETSCHYDRDCRSNWESILGMELPTEQDFRFKRVPQSPVLHGFTNGTSVKGQEKTQAIQAERKKRSVDNFKKEVMPTLPKREKKYFEKKHGKSE